jgi:hypothetical protein
LRVNDIGNKAHRKADFRKGKRLGPDDHIVRWQKPTSIRSVDRKTYHSPPDHVMIREARIRIEQPGFRTKSMLVVTTLLDPEQASKEELAYLYRARWNNELDLRAIKSTMQMEFLRCKTPELVRKEVWAHVLAYKLIRTIIAQAATKHEIKPRSISFKATRQTRPVPWKTTSHAKTKDDETGYINLRAIRHIDRGVEIMG